MRILIVEDDRQCIAYLAKGFSENGFAVDVAETGEDGLHMAREGSYELVILDIMLPKLDGFEVIRALRHAHKEVPVLFLTARDSLHDRVKGLEAGADDYLVKPFSFSELLARVRAVLRRGPARQESRLRVADLDIDLIRHHVERSGVKIHLTPKEFSLLSLLARRAGEVVSRTVIAEQVWDLNFDSETNVIDVQILRLRTKIDGASDNKLLRTVRGMGYVLEDRSTQFAEGQ
jgi:two-component system copper resistance phosphate regulon response regulator CusR